MRTFTFCSSCYHKNDVGAKVCAFCGAPLPSERRAGATTTHVGLPDVEKQMPSPCSSTKVELPRGGIGLFILGQNDPILLEPATGYVLGRRIDPYTPDDINQITEPFSTRDNVYVTSFVDLSLYKAAELGVSRHHTRIFYEDKVFYVEDLSSTNGTWLNEIRLPPNRPYPLHSNDRLLLGRLMMWICLDDRVVEDVSKKFFLRETVTAVSAASSKLTFELLAGSVMPYLAALMKVQHVLDRSEERPLREIHFLTLAASDQPTASKHDCVAAIEAIGLDEALYTVKDRVGPWRNLHSSLIGRQAKTLDTATTQELAQLAAIILSDHNATLPMAQKFPLVEQIVPFLALLVTSKLELTT